MATSYLKYCLRTLILLCFFLTSSCTVENVIEKRDKMSDSNKEMTTLCQEAISARESGEKDTAIQLFKNCIAKGCNGGDSITATIMSEAMIELYNTYQWAEKWHEGAEWFDSLYSKPTPFIAENCQRDLCVFTAMSLSRDSRDSIAEVIIEQALLLPAPNYSPWKYFRDYAYASAILYANPQKTAQTIKYAEKALKYADQSESMKNAREAEGKSYVISILGNLYKRSGRLKEGSDLIRESIANAVEQDDTLAQINGYNALTEMMLYWGIHTQADEYSQKSISLLNKYSGLVKDPLVAAISYAYRGRSKVSQKSDSIMYFWNKAEEISSKMPYTFGMDELDLLISEYYMNMHDSLPEAKKRLSRVVRNASKENVAKAYHFLARIALEEGNENAATMYADSMQMASLSAHRRTHIPGGNVLGLSLALKNNDYDKIKTFSHAFLEEYSANTDPMNTRQLTEIVARHYLSEKNIEVAMEKAKMKNRFLVTIITSAGLILIAILAVISMLYRSRLAKTQKLLLEQRLNTLLSSNSIISKKLENEKKKNTEIQNRLDLLVNDNTERQKIGADAISKVKTSDGLGDFLIRFNILYPSFISNLKKRAPDIGKREQLLCMLIVLECDTEQISNLMSVAPKSVNMARWRLRKKFGLAPDQSLDELIRSLAEEY